jgi:shikimate kinase
VENTSKHQNIFLVGLMGAGKTTVGRALAKRLLLEFYDSDKEIESRTGVSIPTIFEIEGEDGFRAREAKMIEHLSQLSGCVVATGGGAVLRKENRDNMKLNGIVVYLDALPQALWERVRHDRNRPLLQVVDPLLKLKELHAHRDPLYREVADFVVDGSRLSATAVLQLLLREVGDRWKP